MRARLTPLLLLAFTMSACSGTDPATTQAADELCGYFEMGFARGPDEPMLADALTTKAGEAGVMEQELDAELQQRCRLDYQRQTREETTGLRAYTTNHSTCSDPGFVSQLMEQSGATAPQEAASYLRDVSGPDATGATTADLFAIQGCVDAIEGTPRQFTSDIDGS